VANQRYISFVVRALKKFADVFDGVDVLNFAIATRCESFFQRLSGADVAGSGGSGEQEDARFASHAEAGQAVG